MFSGVTDKLFLVGFGFTYLHWGKYLYLQLRASVAIGFETAAGKKSKLIGWWLNNTDNRKTQKQFTFIRSRIPQTLFINKNCHSNISQWKKIYFFQMASVNKSAKFSQLFANHNQPLISLGKLRLYCEFFSLILIYTPWSYTYTYILYLFQKQIILYTVKKLKNVDLFLVLLLLHWISGVIYKALLNVFHWAIKKLTSSRVNVETSQRCC